MIMEFYSRSQSAKIEKIQIDGHAMKYVHQKVHRRHAQSKFSNTPKHQRQRCRRNEVNKRHFKQHHDATSFWYMVLIPIIYVCTLLFILAQGHTQNLCGIDYDHQSRSAPYSNGTWIPTHPQPFATCNASNFCEFTPSGYAKKDAFIQRWSTTKQRVSSSYFDKYGHQYCMGLDREVARIMESMRWIWKPTNCDLDTFDSDRFVKWLESRDSKIVFLGDSISGDMSNSLDGMLRKNGLVLNSRFDYLGTDEHGTYDLSVIKANWNEKAVLHDIKVQDILVINAGAHWTKLGKRTEAKIRNISLAIKSEVKAHTVIWRHSVFGHKGCHQFHRPFTEEEMTPEFREELSSEYNWNDFEGINSVFVKHLSEVLVDRNFQVLDVSMFEMRGDGHFAINGDCLHYCTPSAINEWNKLLYHVLMNMN